MKVLHGLPIGIGEHDHPLVFDELFHRQERVLMFVYRVTRNLKSNSKAASLIQK